MITFKCQCGKAYKVEDRLAGREAKCQQCGQTFIIPKPRPVAPPPVPVPKPVQQVSVPPPVKQATPVLPKVPVHHEKSKNHSKPLLIAGIAGVAGVLLLLLIAGVWWVMSHSSSTVTLPPMAQQPKPVEHSASPIPVESAPTIQKSSRPTIFVAAADGTVPDVRYFVEIQKVDINEFFKGSTALHLAVESQRKIASRDHNQSEVIKYLIENGADVNAKNTDGETPLHRAIRTDNHKYIKLLVSMGANVNAEDRDRFTPLQRAIQYDIPVEIIQLLISSTNVNAKDKDGWTPLHSAMNIELIKLLIANGADINAKNKLDQTPLDAKIIRGKPGYCELVKFLVSSGAEVDAAAIDHAKQRKEMLNEPEGAEVYEYLTNL